MTHQSLYRTHRPGKFSEVAGQEHIVSALQEQLASKTISHAYLFAGSRGLGKTTVARIFADAVGCNEKDLYEIDAASHNSVEDIRELTENVYTLPYESPYKVYILDEAHMLSKGAWNAFLKTLEEPPAHVIFILATTELSKVPDTVQSRCQVFEFRKPTREGVVKLVSSIAKKEGYTLEAGVADLVALLSEGSYRDSLSILERVFAVSGNKTITREEAEKATGAPRISLVADFVLALSKKDTEKALATLATAAKQEVDMSLYLALIFERVRSVLLVRFAPELRKEIQSEVGVETYGEIETLAVAPSALSHKTLRVLLDAAARVRFSPTPVLSLELAVFELEADATV